MNRSHPPIPQRLRPTRHPARCVGFFARWALVALVACFLAQAAGAADPTAEEILARVRLSQFVDGIRLDGQLRSGPDIIPFTLTVEAGRIVYRFQDPEEDLILRLGPERSSLVRVRAGKQEEIDARAAGEGVRGTDVTYEDVSLQFLYWPDASLEGRQIIGPRQTWKIKLMSPNRGSRYAAVFVFVDTAGSALLQMDAYDWDGKFAKRFKVVSGQKIDGNWALKSMRIETMEPGTLKSRSRTYLEIDGKTGL